MKKRMFFKTSFIVLLSAFRVQELPARSPFGVTKTRIDPAISSFTVEDFTGDGVPDFAGADPGHSAIRIYQGNPDGTFDYLRHERTATKCSGLSSGDLNGDGIADLVLLGGSGTTPFVVVELGTGNARFTKLPEILGPSFWGRTRLLDADGDGKLDLLVWHVDENKRAILYGRGDGTFGSPLPVAPEREGLIQRRIWKSSCGTGAPRS